MRQARDAAGLVSEIEVCLSFHRCSKLHESRIQPPIGKLHSKCIVLIFDRFIEANSRAVTSCHSLDWITSPKWLMGMRLNTDARRCGLEPRLQFADRDINTGCTRLKWQIVTVAASYLMRLSFRWLRVLMGNSTGVFRAVGQNDST